MAAGQPPKLIEGPSAAKADEGLQIALVSAARVLARDASEPYRHGRCLGESREFCCRWLWSGRGGLSGRQQRSGGELARDVLLSFAGPWKRGRSDLQLRCGRRRGSDRVVTVLALARLACGA